MLKGLHNRFTLTTKPKNTKRKKKKIYRCLSTYTNRRCCSTLNLKLFVLVFEDFARVFAENRSKHFAISSLRTAEVFSRKHKS